MRQPDMEASRYSARDTGAMTPEAPVSFSLTLLTVWEDGTFNLPLTQDFPGLPFVTLFSYYRLWTQYGWQTNKLTWILFHR